MISEECCCGDCAESCSRIILHPRPPKKILITLSGAIQDPLYGGPPCADCDELNGTFELVNQGFYDSQGNYCYNCCWDFSLTVDEDGNPCDPLTDPSCNSRWLQGCETNDADPSDPNPFLYGIHNINYCLDQLTIDEEDGPSITARLQINGFLAVIYMQADNNPAAGNHWMFGQMDPISREQLVEPTFSAVNATNGPCNNLSLHATFSIPE